MQLPIPPSPLEPPGAVGQVFAFCIAYFVLLSLVLLVLPKSWMRRLIQAAFHLRSDPRLDGEIR